MKASTSKGLVSVATVLMIAFVLVITAAFMPTLSQALRTGYQNSPNMLTKVFMAGLVPFLLIIFVAKAYASEEIEKMKSQGRRPLK